MPLDPGSRLKQSGSKSYTIESWSWSCILNEEFSTCTWILTSLILDPGYQDMNPIFWIALTWLQGLLVVKFQILIWIQIRWSQVLNSDTLDKHLAKNKRPDPDLSRSLGFCALKCFPLLLCFWLRHVIFFLTKSAIFFSDTFSCYILISLQKYCGVFFISDGTPYNWRRPQCTLQTMQSIMGWNCYGGSVGLFCRYGFYSRPVSIVCLTLLLECKNVMKASLPAKHVRRFSKHFTAQSVSRALQLRLAVLYFAWCTNTGSVSIWPCIPIWQLYPPANIRGFCHHHGYCQISHEDLLWGACVSPVSQRRECWT